MNRDFWRTLLVVVGKVRDALRIGARCCAR